PFPKLRGQTWIGVAREMLAAENDRTNFHAALTWFGQALRALHDDIAMDVTERPWKAAFDRAEARGGTREPREVYGDWLADEIWCLEWAATESWDRVQVDLRTRLAVADRMRVHLESLGVAPGRAAAETLTI